MDKRELPMGQPGDAWPEPQEMTIFSTPEDAQKAAELLGRFRKWATEWNEASVQAALAPLREQCNELGVELNHEHARLIEKEMALRDMERQRDELRRKIPVELRHYHWSEIKNFRCADCDTTQLVSSGPHHFVCYSCWMTNEADAATARAEAAEQQLAEQRELILGMRWAFPSMSDEWRGKAEQLLNRAASPPVEGGEKS